MSATVDGSLDFYPMPDAPASTVLTAVSKSRQSTFKAVEDMPFASQDHLKGLIILIAADFTVGHMQHSFLWWAFLLKFLPPEAIRYVGEKGFVG
jgi:hypothetical protein